MKEHRIEKMHTFKTRTPSSVLVGMLLAVLSLGIILAVSVLGSSEDTHSMSNVFAEGSYTPVDAVIEFVCLESQNVKNTTYNICIKSDDANAPLPKDDKVLINSSGKGKFQIELNEPGTYVYTVYQEKGSDPDIQYDDTMYDIYVYVTNNENDQLAYTVSVTYADTDQKPVSVDFKNEKKKDSSGRTEDTSETPSKKQTTEAKTDEVTEDGGTETTEKTEEDTSEKTDTTEDTETTEKSESTEATTEKTTDETKVTTETTTKTLDGDDKDKKSETKTKTGDEVGLLGLIMTFVISIIGITLILVQKRRNKENEE